MQKIILVSLFIGIGFIAKAAEKELDLMFLKAQFHFLEKDFNKALSYLDSSVLKFPKSKRANERELMKGILFYELGKTEEAIGLFEKLEKQKKGIETYWLSLCHIKNGDLELAVASLQKHLESKYKKPMSDVRTDDNLRPLHELQSWNKLWLKDWYTKRELLAEDIRYNLEQEDYYTAKDQLDESILKNAKNHKMFYLRGKCFIYLDDNTAAISDVSKAVSLKKKEKKYLDLYIELLFKEGKFKKAQQVLTQKQKYQMLDYSDLLLMAQVEIKLAKYKKAEDYLKQYAFVTDGNYNWQKTQLELFVKQNKKLQALRMVNKLIQKNPKKYYFYYQRALIYAQMSKWSQSLHDFDEALKLNKTDQHVIYDKAEFMLKRGNKKEACLLYEKLARKGNLNAMRKYNLNCER